MKKYLMIVSLVSILMAVEVLLQRPAIAEISPSYALGNESLDADPDHGQGYGGLLTLRFFRMTPDFICEKKLAALASIDWNGEKAVLRENKKNACDNKIMPLKTNELDFSNFQSFVIGYKDGIFEERIHAPMKAEPELVEVWCRDRNDNLGIETITRFNSVTGKASNTAYYSKLEGGERLPKQMVQSDVSRQVQYPMIEISDSHGFELNVDRSQAALKAGQFVGHLKIVIDDQEITRETSCRLGGSLDSLSKNHF